MPGASASGSRSGAETRSHPIMLPDPNTFSQAYGGIYSRDMAKLLPFLQNWTGQLQNSALQQGGQAFNQDIGQMGQLLGLENANKSAAAQGNFQNYANYEAPLQMLQSQVMDLNARQKDPEYFDTRANTANQLNQLISGNLTGVELSNMERGLNRQFLQNGTFNTPGNTQQLQAATTYGDAGRNRSIQGLGLAKDLLPAMRTSEVGPVSTQNRQISDAFAKTDTSGTNDMFKTLFYNPTDKAIGSFNQALGIPQSDSSSRSTSGGIGCS